MSRKARIILILVIGVGGLVIAVSLPGKGEESGVSFWDRLSCAYNEVLVKLGLRSRKPCIPALTQTDKTTVMWANKQQFDANNCIANLKQLEAAKATWALDNKKSTTDTPTATDLIRIQYIAGCPEGGIHVIGSMTEKPCCSIPGHTL